MTDVEHELSAIRFVVVSALNYFLIKGSPQMFSIKNLAKLCKTYDGVDLPTSRVEKLFWAPSNIFEIKIKVNFKFDWFKE